MNTLVFFHIPKTGGSTLLSVLPNEFKNKKIYVVSGGNLVNSVQRLISSKQKYDLIMGHNLLNIHEKLKYDVNYFSFVREPFDHFLSTFYYIKTRKHNRYNKYLANLTLEEYLNSNMKIQDLNNYQTRVLGGYYDYGALMSNKYDFIKNGDKYLNTALKNTNNIDDILLFEKYDKSLLYLKNKYKLSNNILKYDKKNVTKNRKKINDFPSRIREKIYQNIKYDIILYEKIKEKDKI
jgi:hypothetical protein